MSAQLSPVLHAAWIEVIQLLRSPVLLILTVVQGLTFLFLVSLFGLTGAMAPTALVNYDQGPHSKEFIQSLEESHHSFRLMPMDIDQADDLLSQGRIVAELVIPPSFSQAVDDRAPAQISLDVDNIDADMTNDIERGIPSAVLRFAKRIDLPILRAAVEEHNVVDHETAFIPYLIVSALALDAFLVAGILAGTSVTREFETGTAMHLRLAPIHPLKPFIGRMLGADLLALIALLFSAAIVFFGYGVVPVNPAAFLGSIVLSVLVFGCVGAALGCALKKTIPVAMLTYGLALPLFVISGAIEPSRFDGEIVWVLAHLSPLYYAIGLLENSAHGLRVTTESAPVDALLIVAWGVAALALAGAAIGKEYRR